MQAIKSQQDPAYSQYMFNAFLLNPAAAGSDGSSSVSLTARQQWLGIEGPTTVSLSGQTRVLKNSFIAKALSLRKKFSKRSSSGRVGLGAHIFNDVNGPIRRTGMHITYAYHIPLRQSQLSFGITMMPYQFAINQDKIKNVDIADDPLLAASRDSRYVIDGNFGMQFTSPLFFGGMSVTNLMESQLKFGDNSTAGYQILRHYCLMGGYKVEINKLIMLEPTSLIKFTELGTFQMEVTARGFYRQEYWAGLSYRTGAAAGTIVFITGMRLKNYYFSYAFDFNMSPIMYISGNKGTHEFIFTMKFGDNARRYRWLNRY